mmetsp:Transcript_15105/g.25969  ORF Transcript_15105/g.25969 Transcript_15105/m.25969 type:complete len:214 (-) Transcript_15105:164-805(-)
MLCFVCNCIQFFHWRDDGRGVWRECVLGNGCVGDLGCAKTSRFCNANAECHSEAVGARDVCVDAVECGGAACEPLVVARVFVDVCASSVVRRAGCERVIHLCRRDDGRAIHGLLHYNVCRASFARLAHCRASSTAMFVVCASLRAPHHLSSAHTCGCVAVGRCAWHWRHQSHAPVLVASPDVPLGVASHRSVVRVAPLATHRSTRQTQPLGHV